MDGNLSNKRIIIIALIIGISIGLISLLSLKYLRYNMQSEKVLRFSFPSVWGALNPAQQNSAIGSMILSAQFNSLAKFNSNGLIEPDLAKTWKVNSDFTIYNFDIDTTRRFSDGSPLTALDVKQSWEEGLKVESQSSNHSMTDTLYMVEGFEEFEKTGQLRGVVVKSDSVLQIRFKKPFRLAIDHLSGIRFAVTKKIGSEYIGTGPYQITKVEPEYIELRVNPNFDEKPEYTKLEIYYLPYPKDMEALQSDKIDVSMGHLFYNVPECDDPNKGLKCIAGQEASHLIIPVNGLNGRLFADPKLRLALQYIIKSGLQQDSRWQKFFVQGFELDDQVFLPIQAGRLPAETANAIIESGKQYVPMLQKASKKTPITFFSTSHCALIKDILEKSDISVKEFNNGEEGLTGINVYYKTYTTDMLIMTLSIVHGDPDGIYHALGKTGAIASKMTVRDSVTSLLEEGRSLTEIDKLDFHYKKVSEAILKEVPFVHLGFTRRLFIYNKNKIKINDVILHRRGIDFNVFEKL